MTVHKYKIGTYYNIAGKYLAFFGKNKEGNLFFAGQDEEIIVDSKTLEEIK